MSPGLSIAAAGALTVIGSIAQGRQPSPRTFLGVVVAGGGLLLLAQSMPDAAAQLAAVILLTSALTSGYDVATGINRALNR